MTLCTLPFTKIAFAEQYQLKLIADLAEINDVSTNPIWLEPLTSPTNGGFFVAQDNGLIYLVGSDGVINQDAVLNLPLSANIPSFISLTSMTLHPSFTMPERLGYATFYTAHTTKFAQEKYSNRLTLNDTNIQFAFETVITAWKYDFEKQKIDLQTQREILRIPIKSNDTGIQQLTFDPYQKVWNADYGQLYFSLRYIDELKEHSLYSGVILRVLPQMFGARNYTVSRANPFIKKSEINNEIVVMGGHDIEHFFWTKNSHGSIFTQHNNGKQYWLSKAKVGDDLFQADSLWEQQSEMALMLFYQGRDFLSLRNKMLFFTLIKNQWNLTSLALDRLSDEPRLIEDVITTEAISTNSQLNIYQDHRDEIIIFDNQLNRLYSLQSTNEKVIQDSQVRSATAAFKSIHYVLLIILLAVLLTLFIFIKRKNGVYKFADDSLNKTYVRFEYDLIKQTILLFRVNKEKEHQSLSLGNIVRCEVLFNNKVINAFDAQPENVISNQIDTQIRAFFTKEESVKMVDDQTRKIEIILFDQNTSYIICPYLRKGNTRVTGKAYSEVIDMLIELCWIISKRLNQHVTDTRIIPVAAFSRSYYASSATQPDKLQPTDQDDSNDNLVIPEITFSQLIDQATVDINVVDEPVVDVVDALDKLVDLHKKGYLTDEEFSLAKTKLLQ